MTDHAWGGVFTRKRESRPSSSRATRRGLRKPQFDLLEARQLLVASLAPIANLAVPQLLGYQLPLNGSGSTAPQSFSVRSDNPNVKAAVAQGSFLTLNVTHTAAPGVAGDVTFAGPVTFQLFEDLTPLTTSRIEALVASGFYTGKNFHRIAGGFPGPSDYIVQGGSVSGTGTGDVGLPGYPFADEFNQQLAFTGTGQLAMANAGDDTNQSQFFVTTGSPRSLDFQHTIFGQIVSGQEIIAQMTQVATGTGQAATTPLSPVLISSATLSDVAPHGVIHIDTTSAVAGDVANLVVTAVDPSTNTTAAQSFRVDVTADPASVNERPFLQPVENQTVAQNQVATFQLRGVDADPEDVLTYIVQGGTSPNGAAFTPVQNATATVDSATGIVRVTPNAGFTGTINLTVGVRDAVNRSGGSLDAPSNFDTQRLTLTVNPDATPVNLRPIALPIRASVGTNTPMRIQLAGDNANPGSAQGLTFSIVSPPTRGTITEFNAETGTLLYTPAPGFNGPDRFLYTVRDTGAPFPNLESFPSAVTLDVTPATTDTGTVRLISNVLVVTPRPRTDRGTNSINITQRVDPAAGGEGRIVVSINGEIDETQPFEADLLRIVVYGSKANDLITVDPSVTVPATLDGGHGGRNRLKAGGAPTTLHGWFGSNVLAGGPERDRLVGRAGRVRFVASPGGDIAFEGSPSRDSNGEPEPPEGTFYRFVRGKLVALPDRESDGPHDGGARPHPRPHATRPHSRPRTGPNRNS